MSLLFFSDQCVPREITERLKAADFAVIVLRDVMPIRSPDPEVIAEAQRREAILLSLNGDFSDIITYPPSAYGGYHCYPATQPSRDDPHIDDESGDVPPGEWRARILSGQIVARRTAPYSHPLSGQVK